MVDTKPNQILHLGINVLSIEFNINIRIGKSCTAIERLFTIENLIFPIN